MPNNSSDSSFPGRSSTPGQRSARLDAARAAVDAAGERTGEVLAAINETFHELPGPLSIPRHPLVLEAVEDEIRSTRAERIGIEGAIAALDATIRGLNQGLFSGAVDWEEFHERNALQEERQRYRERLAVVDLVMQDLFTARRKVDEPGRESSDDPR